jgi:hypothetical protein
LDAAGIIQQEEALRHAVEDGFLLGLKLDGGLLLRLAQFFHLLA